MRKVLEENNDVHNTLLHYRNTPVSGMAYSHAQLLMSRNLRDSLPVAEEVLRPKFVEGAHQSLLKRQQSTTNIVIKVQGSCQNLTLETQFMSDLEKHGLQVKWPQSMPHPDPT